MKKSKFVKNKADISSEFANGLVEFHINEIEYLEKVKDLQVYSSDTVTRISKDELKKVIQDSVLIK